MGQIHARDETLLANSALLRFAQEARSFVDLVEHHSALSDHDLLLALNERVALLYSLAHRLPDIEWDDISDEEEAEGKAIAEQIGDRARSESEIRRVLANRFSSYDLHHLVFDPPQGGDTVTSYLSDDVASVYGDLRYGLQVFESRTEAGAIRATWDWKFDFQCHWGRHAAVALAAIDSLLNRLYDEDKETFSP